MRKSFALLTCLVSSFVLFAQDATISMNPANMKQQVVFGGDGKLTIKAWGEMNPDKVAERLFVDMDLKILRVPIFALQPLTDPVYDHVVTVIKSVQAVNPDVKIFVSVANGDGYGVDHHGTHKFPSTMTGCCPNNVYSLNLTAYAKYLDGFMQIMADNNIVVDYFGPFNEDPADKEDYMKLFSQMKKLGGAKKIGLERWALQTTINDVLEQQSQIDIAGSHFYDDVTLTDWDGKWRELVNKTSLPVWYTESTRYKTTDGVDKLVAGMNNIYPAINGGAEAVVFYQVVKRFVWANGGISGQYKYTGFQNIVNTSTGKNVIPITLTGSDMRSTAFYDGETISLHVTNTSSQDKSTTLQILSGYKANGVVTRTIWTENDVALSNSYTLTNNGGWNVTIPANSYTYFEIPATNLVTSINTSNPDQDINLSPNPCTNELQITATNPAFELVNFMGEQMEVESTFIQNTLEINTSDLAQGIYMISVDGKTKKFIKK